MILRRDVFQAISDPSRRQIIQKITRQPLTVNEIAEAFRTSRQAISKHIQILTECGLVEISQQGRERLCEVRLEKLDEVTGWVEQSRKQWMQRFGKLDKLLDSKIKNKSHDKKSKRQQ